MQIHTRRGLRMLLDRYHLLDGYALMAFGFRCPPTSSIDGSEDPRLFDDEVLPESPVVKEASMKLPGVNA